MTTATDPRDAEPNRTPITDVDAVLFDLDGTLVDYDQRGEELLPAAFDRAGIEPFCTDADLEAVAHEVAFEPERAHADYWTEVFARVARRHGGDPNDAPALYEAYGAVFDRTRVHLLPGASAALSAARSSHRVGLVTNGERAIQEAKLASLGLSEAFETAVYADEVADPKPAPEPFGVALEDLGVAPGDALYVGNSLRYDVAGARAAGLRVALCPHERPIEDGGSVDREPDYVFESLHGLAAVLDGEANADGASTDRADNRGESR